MLFVFYAHPSVLLMQIHSSVGITKLRWSWPWRGLSRKLVPWLSTELGVTVEVSKAHPRRTTLSGHFSLSPQVARERWLTGESGSHNLTDRFLGCLLTLIVAVTLKSTWKRQPKGSFLWLALGGSSWRCSRRYSCGGWGSCSLCIPGPELKR